MTNPSHPGIAADAERPLRLAATAALEAGDTPRAIQAARDLLLASPSIRSARALRGALAAQRAQHPGLKAIRVALLSIFSSDFLHDHLVAWGLAGGLDVDLYQAGFGLFRQEILDPGSGLYRYEPDVVVVAVEGEDWIPGAYRDFLRAGGAGADPEATLAAWRDEAAVLLRTLRARTSATVLIHNFAPPAYGALGAADAKHGGGQQAVVRRLHDALGALAAEVTDVHVVDYAALVNRHGALNWYDARMRHYARAPIAGPMQSFLAAEYAKFLRALRGLAKKCLVVDLDNTLWGGVVGEDGPLGVKLGATYPGSAFAEFQRYLLDLHARGVILAIASKNNPADVDEVFAVNEAMVLAQSHFAAMEVHWRFKRESLASIAARLGIGLEHVVFVDDNPVECEEVRRNLPAVTVICLPPQPERFVEALAREGLFDTLGLSAEDRRRGELYQQRARAEELRTSTGSVEDYYRDLQMRIRFAPVDRASLARAAQLTQKTNQFNVTTRRSSEADVARRAADPAWSVATVGVRDRFGDNGIVGVVMARQVDDVVDIDTLLMSCRVIGRTGETAMLAYLCDQARERGAKAVTGTIVPTAKNEPVRDLFTRHAFVQTGEDPDGTTRWRLDLAAGGIAWPEWFERSIEATASEAGD
jgi:FkbH-like protein